MESVLLPSNEKERLEFLQGLNILDTRSESVFDNVVQMASTICEMPISLISLIDKNRQWFKAKKGIEVDETSREVAFCARAILQSDVFVVKDASKDLRFSKNPLVVSGPQIRFYAGIPLVVNDYALGTLCVIDQIPRVLSEQQLRTLKLLAQQAVELIHFRKTKGIVDTKKINSTLPLTDLGEIVARIGHQIRNPLTYAAGANQLVLMNLGRERPDLEVIRKNSERIEKSMNQISHIANGLKIMSKSGSQDEISQGCIQSIVSEALEFCQSKLQEHSIELRTQISKERIMFHCCPAQIVQVLINLLDNACDAILNASEKWIQIEANDSDNFLYLSVTDSGSGIPSELRPHLMQPFFTTKAPGKGMGLGLSVSRDIIEVHGGQIFYDDSSINTRFIVQMPINLL